MNRTKIRHMYVVDDKKEEEEKDYNLSSTTATTTTTTTVQHAWPFPHHFGFIESLERASPVVKYKSIIKQLECVESAMFPLRPSAKPNISFLINTPTECSKISTQTISGGKYSLVLTSSRLATNHKNINNCNEQAVSLTISPPRAAKILVDTIRSGIGLTGETFVGKHPDFQPIACFENHQQEKEKDETCCCFLVSMIPMLFGNQLFVKNKQLRIIKTVEKVGFALLSNMASRYVPCEDHWIGFTPILSTIAVELPFNQEQQQQQQYACMVLREHVNAKNNFITLKQFVKKYRKNNPQQVRLIQKRIENYFQLLHTTFHFQFHYDDEEQDEWILVEEEEENEEGEKSTTSSTVTTISKEKVSKISAKNKQIFIDNLVGRWLFQVPRLECEFWNNAEVMDDFCFGNGVWFSNYNATPPLEMLSCVLLDMLRTYTLPTTDQFVPTDKQMIVFYRIWLQSQECKREFSGYIDAVTDEPFVTSIGSEHTTFGRHSKANIPGAWLSFHTHPFQLFTIPDTSSTNTNTNISSISSSSSLSLTKHRRKHNHIRKRFSYLSSTPSVDDVLFLIVHRINQSTQQDSGVEIVVNFMGVVVLNLPQPSMWLPTFTLMMEYYKIMKLELLYLPQPHWEEIENGNIEQYEAAFEIHTNYFTVLDCEHFANVLFSIHDVHDIDRLYPHHQFQKDDELSETQQQEKQQQIPTIVLFYHRLKKLVQEVLVEVQSLFQRVFGIDDVVWIEAWLRNTALRQKTIQVVDMKFYRFQPNHRHGILSSLSSSSSSTQSLPNQENNLQVEETHNNTPFL